MFDPIKPIDHTAGRSMQRSYHETAEHIASGLINAQRGGHQQRIVGREMME